MTTEQPGSDSPREGRFQYSLQTLMALTTALALMLGMYGWRGELGLLEYFLGAGVCVIAVGVWKRRRRLIILGVLVIVGIQLALQFSAQHITFVSRNGTTGVVIPVQVVDAKTGRPVAKATVSVPSCGSAVTDAVGLATVEGAMEYVSGEYGTLFGTWGQRAKSYSPARAEIRADGYQPAIVDLDRLFGEAWEASSQPLPDVTVRMQPIGPAAPPAKR